jgi:FkbM family methyltransferase
MLDSTILQLLERRPIGYIDIGARGGVHPIVDPIAAATAVLGFEPDEAECARILQDRSAYARFSHFELESAALSNLVGPAQLHHVSAATNTSLLEPNPVFVKRYDMVKWHECGRSWIETTTLDRVLSGKSNDIPWGEAIKIDTQGSEYEILLGAQKTLQERTRFLCIEVSFCQLYSGQKLFSDIEVLLRNFGFSFYGFDRMFHRSRKSLDKRTHWGRERLIQADAYFFKDPFDPSHSDRGNLDRRSRIIISAFALMAGYHDFALEILESTGEAGNPLRDAVRQFARLSVEASTRDVETLSAAVRAHPKEANVLVGRFVDERRLRNDYHDVL